jgi:acetylornithine deacetylase/succinyl-diaminopimelate desuccinylase-like protein
MVCDYASAFLTRFAGGKLVNYENPVAGTTFSYDNTTNLLQVRGKSAHGSTPHKGANALEALLCFLSTFNEDCKKAYDLLFADVCHLKELQDETGKLTMSPNVASFVGGVLKIKTDIRFPATMALETVTEKLDEYGLEYTINNYQPPLFNDINDPLIQTLTKVYNEAMGSNETPIAIGGGTYARALKRGCAFGPEINGEEETIHQPNEYVTFDRIRLMSEIYYEAVKKTCGAQEERNTFHIATINKALRLTPVKENEKPQEKTEGVKILTLRKKTTIK